uniref:STRIPE RUST resistance protein Yr10 n=1 Tax=Triticum aestivum TaxID=4565 RepID=Q9FR64_WHEAT|nr:stripe rust resistance protein Yr10 [Triticum aestivum]ADY39271.1 stripe rust resistance protein YR10 [Triticum aestivum]ADY39272.1 stripe rust resistance protein YR10 [Triticum aestivum]
MEVVTGAMSTLLPLLGDLLKEEYNLQKSTKGEIKFLKAELESMEAALIKISEAPLDQPPNIQVKLWARDVKDLSYEIEDGIDKFRVHLECRQQKKPHSFMGFIHKSMDMLTKGKIRHKIGIDIKDIKSRIKEVSDRRERYKVDSVAPKPTGTSTDTLRQLALFKKAEELIGTKEKSLDIVKMLTEGDEVFKKHLKMVSIVGFGGLGKTTLANVVYEKLRGDFDCAAFVSVSLNPDMKKLFKCLLHQLDKGEYKNIMDESAWSETQLISEIRDFLRDKRYFILIDDIWDKSVWNNIRCALIENECGSRVIATTRILDVAKEVGGVYQLKPLSTSDSRQLFYQRIFGIGDKRPPIQLAEVSEKILGKCGGVPLAIITLASMLAGKKEHENTYTYWYKVYQSMGSGLENNPGLMDMRRILHVSYYDLPPNLKTCLLYLSLYPEDYNIETKELIWKWIGEGFIHEEQGKSLYEVGEDYIAELINKSLVQPMYINIANKASSVRVHDMVLDLITSLSNEENFLATLGGQQTRSLPSKIRRLSLQSSNEEDVQPMPTMSSLSHVRSLTVFSKDLSLLSALSGFLVLRALDLSGCEEVGNHHMKDICNLFHLRYLSLEGTSITEIPKEISNLRLLQLLVIRSTKMKKFPSTFVQLGQLVFIDMGNREVSRLLLKSMSTLPSLSSLAIGIGELREEDLQILGSMPSLHDLSIDVGYWERGRDKRLVIDSGSPFRSLTRFSIKGCGFIDFMFAQGTLQKLQILELSIFGKAIKDRFGDFQFGLENLSSLEHVYVDARGRGIIPSQEAELSGALEKELDINPNKPTLTVKVTPR